MKVAVAVLVVLASAGTTGCSGPPGDAFCGDGVVDDTETCDTGDRNSDVTPNACRSDCTRARCGDGVTDATEACDSGPLRSDVVADQCRMDCSLPGCGDGVVDTGESCDDGNAASEDGCSATCQLESCGDGILQRSAGEACDDGNLEPGDGCSQTCEDEFCGDTIVQALLGEECEDGNSVFDDGCFECLLEVCGDGIVQLSLGEVCDKGAGNSDTVPDGCRTDCQRSRCGDGVKGLAEECDDGNAFPDDGCTPLCHAEFCGDGKVQGPLGEECDDGGTAPGDGCSGSCVIEFCGDGVQQIGLGETCDDGGTVSNDGCSATCRVEYCGDGVVQLGAGEVCDDGNNTPEDGCDALCQVEFCGDGTTQALLGEECDDGATLPDDGCGPTCLIEYCGDGIRQPFLGEQCDDGGTVPGDGCDGACQSEFCVEDIYEDNDLPTETTDLMALGLPVSLAAAMCMSDLSPVYDAALDFYEVTLGVNEGINVALGDGATTTCQNQALYLHLYPTDLSTLIAGDLSDGLDCPAFSAAPGPGTYFVLVWTGSPPSFDQDYQLDVSIAVGCSPEIPGNGIDEDCDGFDDLLVCSQAGVLSSGASGSLTCGDTTLSQDWDTYTVPVNAGDCIHIFADNDSATRADLRAFARDANGISFYGEESDYSELEDEAPCSTTPWNNFACPAAMLTAVSTGDFFIALSQWRGGGSTAGVDRCYDNAGYTLFVAVNGVDVTPTLSGNDVQNP